MGDKAKIEGIVAKMRANMSNLTTQIDGCKELDRMAHASKPNRSLIAKAGGIEVLVLAMRTHEFNAVVQEWTCRAFCNLIYECPENQENVSNAGGIEVVIKAIRNHLGTPSVPRYGCMSLNSITSSFSEGRIKVGELGGIAAIINAMRTHESKAEIQEWGCSALANVTLKNTENKEMVYKEGGIQAVAKAMTAHPNDQNVQHYGSMLISNMTSTHAPSRNAATDCNVAQLVIDAMATHLKSENVQDYGCRVFCNITLQHPTNQSQLGRLGGIQTIVNAMRAHPASEEVQKNGCNAVWGISECASNLPYILDAGAVELVKIAKGRFPAKQDLLTVANGALDSVDRKLKLAPTTVAQAPPGIKSTSSSSASGYTSPPKQQSTASAKTSNASTTPTSPPVDTDMKTLETLLGQLDITQKTRTILIENRLLTEKALCRTDADTLKGIGIPIGEIYELKDRFPNPGAPHPNSGASGVVTPKTTTPSYSPQKPTTTSTFERAPTRREELRNELSQVRYVGVLKMVSGYNPPKSCRDHMMEDLSIVLDGCSQISLIIDESMRVAESCLQHVSGNVPKLPEDEALAISAYTYDLGFNSEDPTQEGRDNLYFVLNNVLRERNAGKMMRLKPFLTYLMRGLTLLPPTEATVYRGIPVSATDIVKDKYRTGAPVHWSAFTSTTTNLKKAQDFASKEGPGGIIFRIKCIQGRSVAPYSAIPTEDEVILSPNCKLTVVGELHPEGAWGYVDLVENRGEGFVF